MGFRLSKYKIAQLKCIRERKEKNALSDIFIPAISTALEQELSVPECVQYITTYSSLPSDCDIIVSWYISDVIDDIGGCDWNHLAKESQQYWKEWSLRFVKDDLKLPTGPAAGRSCEWKWNIKGENLAENKSQSIQSEIKVFL